MVIVSPLCQNKDCSELLDYYLSQIMCNCPEFLFCLFQLLTPPKTLWSKLLCPETLLYDALSLCSYFPHVYFYMSCFAASVFCHTLQAVFLIIGENRSFYLSINDLFWCPVLNCALWAVVHIYLESSSLIVVDPRNLVCKQKVAQ